MIVFENGDTVVRIGEADLSGRRIAARAIPYVGEAGPPAFRVDPIERVVILRTEAGVITAGPSDPDEWRRAVSRAPAGPVLVGPSNRAEPVRGSARAAAEGAASAGRAVYLLDPEPEGVPEGPIGRFVCVFCGIPDAALLERLRSAARRTPAGLLLPVIPGWTAESDALDRAVSQLADAGATFVAPIALPPDGDSRRRAVEARRRIDPESADAFFDRAHHGDWAGDSAAAIAKLRDRVAARGLAAMPPRPRGEGEPAGNSAAAARLEELADREIGDEHRAAMLRGGARWMDESGRDLATVASEGNFRKVFPFGGDVAEAAESALRQVR